MKQTEERQSAFGTGSWDFPNVLVNVTEMYANGNNRMLLHRIIIEVSWLHYLDNSCNKLWFSRVLWLLCMNVYMTFEKKIIFTCRCLSLLMLKIWITLEWKPLQAVADAGVVKEVCGHFIQAANTHILSVSKVAVIQSWHHNSDN